MRHKKVEKREPEGDKMYQNVLVAKFINRMMYSGKKTVAEGVVYGAFDIIKAKNQDPLEVFEKALQTKAKTIMISKAIIIPVTALKSPFLFKSIKNPPDNSTQKK